ncbi:acetyl-CoA carboxylase carboxyltransferase subunit alpha [Actinomadura litoris]|uniref:acetyl-CoA carboxylase carboxyltransferase subunit alpha n=1 Tax=Actinomadura litoris TaxID=2678616 RepID=UPI001FA78533|nr:acetyl-CoA carboxylase carboxyltransferase subunit alpha [Actinomadura litoris]
MTALDARGAALAADPAEEKWLRCGRCGVSVYIPRLVRNRHVCPECGHHRRLGARERLDVLVDEGSFSPAEQVRGADPLGFSDSRPYTDRLATARRRTGLADAMLYGGAAIGGHPVMVAVMDFGFMGGSMGSAVGETVARAAEEAEARRWPLVLVAGSGGARMQEGALSLMQMAKTAQALERLRDAGVPSVCVLTDPTFGGVTASFATLTDLLVAERGGLIGFAGPRVIKAATRETLPAGFQTAEYLKEQGMLDRVEPRDGLRPLLARLLTLLAGDRKPPSGASAGTAARTAARASGRSAWETVRLARDIARPTTLDYIWRICGDFVALHGDRHFRDDPAIVGGIGDIDGVSVMIIGHQKGHDTKELVARGFGMPGPEGYRKALRLMRRADTLGLPVVTLVDTQGAAPGIGAEERGQAWAISECVAGMSRLRVPVVSTVTGEGGSGGALALAVANTVLMMENACYSVISPESCSTILHGDPSKGAEMAEALRVTAPELLALGVVDGVVDEPEGGAQADPAAAAASLKAAVLSALADLGGLDGGELRDRRHARFRRQGVVVDG